MGAGPTELESRRAVRPLDLATTQAVLVLRKAGRAMLDAMCQLLATDLSPVAGGILERRHDRAAQRVTAARFALDQVLDASEDS